MTERVRRRTSKWDLKDDPDKFATGTRQDNASFGKASESIHDNGSIQEWNSSKNAGSRNSKWSDTNSDSAFMPEGNSRWSRWEPSSGNRAEHKDDNDNRDFNEVPQNMKAWDSNRSYSTSMSPGLDEWRQRSRSRSPKRGWSKLHRSRSRSPLHHPRSRSRSPPHRLRSRSRSPPHGLRSRSTSPPHGLKRDSEGWNDRIRGESRVSVCNDFARGRCRRGSQCRFLHQDNTEYEGRRHSGSVSVENWGSRHDRGGSYGHPNNVERDYSRDKLFHGHDIQRNNRSSDRCLNFLKGSCHRGSSCRFIHESSVDDGRGTSERTHERDIRSYSGHDHRREPYRNNSTPCKYFAVGNCRKGINCKFSHEGAVHDRPEGGSGDDRRGHNLGDENKSWGGPKWSDEATDSAHGSAEGRPLNYGSSHIASTWDDPGWKKKQTWNDNEAATGRPEPRSADERWGHNLGDQNKSWGGPKWGDETAGTANGIAEGRSVTDGRGCITDSEWGGPKWGDEAAGRANGSVEGRPLNDGVGRIANSGWGGPKWGVEVADRPEAVSADVIRGHNLVDENKSWEGPKWGDEAALPTDASVEASSLNEGRGQIVNNGCDQATDSEVKKFPQWGNDDSGGQLGVSDENQLLVDTKWTGSATESEVTNTSEWRNDENDVDVKSRIAGSWPTQRSLDDRTNNSLDDQNRPWGVPTWTDKPSDQAAQKFPPWASDNNSASMGVPLPRGHEEMLNFTNAPAGSGRDQYPHLIDNEKPTFGIQDPQSRPQGIVISHEQTSTPEISGQQHYPTVGMYPEGQKHPHPASTFMMHPAVSSMNAQGQQILLSPAPRVQNFDLNGPVEDVSSPNHQRLFHMGETTKEAGNIDPEMSPITSGASLTQNIVTSEQVAQISHLSASLAQIFGNSQQLPQLYATLNSTNPIGLVPPPPNTAGIGATVGFVPPPPNSAGLGASVGGSFVQSDQTTWSQQQYDPLSSMESSQISIHPLGFSDMPVKQNDTTDHELQASLQSSVPPSVVGGSNGSDPAKNGSLEKTLHHQSNELRQVESVGNERAVDRFAKEQNPAHSGDTNADGRFDEDGKKIKDTKGMRIFKFALVEFVKEILKPTWKEGQLSKEAHKTVVKKVVDKVTGSVQGDHIPQTQEKIDQYLAYSKTKLTKLVEAYVEKYVKS